MTPRRLLTEQELKQKIEAVRWRASSPSNWQNMRLRSARSMAFSKNPKKFLHSRNNRAGRFRHHNIEDIENEPASELTDTCRRLRRR